MDFKLLAAIELQNDAASYHRCAVVDFDTAAIATRTWLAAKYQEDAARCSAIARGLMGIRED